MLFALSAACTEPATDAPVADLSVAVHDDVATILVVTWTQHAAAAAVAVEYRFDGSDWASTPPADLDAGAHDAVVLGLPPDTEVELRLVGETDGAAWTSSFGGRTDPLPQGFPTPSLVSWDPDLADAGRWLFTTVATGESDYEGPWWAYILDRQARVVWYRAIDDGRVSVMSRPAADGTHLTWDEVSWFGDPSTLERTTLDGRWQGRVELPLVGYTYAELPDGTVAYDAWSFGGDITLRTIAPDGTLTDVWSCHDWLPEGHPWDDCGTNTVNWSEARGTFLWSQYGTATIVEVDPVAGAAVGSWGDLGEDPLAPADARLQMQHYPYWTDAGTLLTHVQEAGEARVQWAREFTWDEASNGLTQVWSYRTEDRYAECSGEAVRLAGGNTLLNYGCGQAIREVTPDGAVAWEVETGALIGHQSLVDDLYALNVGR